MKRREDERQALSRLRAVPSGSSLPCFKVTTRIDETMRR